MFGSERGGGSIVDDEDLEIRMGLRLHGGQGAPQQGGAVPGGDYDRNAH